MDNTALGFVGGFAGRALEGRLLNEGINSDFTHVSGETRTNILIHELSDLVGRELEDLDEFLEAARDINKRDVEIVLVSMGTRGILLVNECQKYLAVPPQHQVRNTIGAVDSSVAGSIFGLIGGKSLHVALAYAAAAGTATTQSQGTALCQKKDFEEILLQVKIEAVGISKNGSKGS